MMNISVIDDVASYLHVYHVYVPYLTAVPRGPLDG